MKTSKAKRATASSPKQAVIQCVSEGIRFVGDI
jgi:hypothetical protein